MNRKWLWSFFGGGGGGEEVRWKTVRTYGKILATPLIPSNNSAGSRRKLYKASSSDYDGQFQNWVFIPHCAGEILKPSNHQLFSLNLCLGKTRSRKSPDSTKVIVYEHLRFQNVFRANKNSKPSFSNSSGLKSVSEKLRFRDGLIWTVSLTVEIKLRFQISPTWFARGGINIEG